MEIGTIPFDEDARAQREEANSKTRLLSLPAELRNRIYTLADVDRCYLTPQRSLESQATILQTSRQLRKETMPIVYGNFHYLGDYNWLSCGGIPWLNLISEDAVRSLRSLEFMCDGHYPCGDGEIRTHVLDISIERGVDGFQYMLRSNWIGVSAQHKTTLDDCNNCPAVGYLHRKAMPVLDRMKAQQSEVVAIDREGLLALFNIARDLTSHQGEIFEQWADSG